ncbi:MAG: hypothetical protein U1E97_11715 [Alphaproteobacteria bacterium]
MARTRITYSIVLPLVAGIALFALAIPRFLSGLPLSDPDPVLRTLADRDKVDEKRLNEAARARLRSLAIVKSGRVSYELGLMRLHLAQYATDELHQQLLAEASDDTRTGILANPAQPFAWMQLVQLSMLRSGDSGLRAAANYYPLAVSTRPETPGACAAAGRACPCPVGPAGRERARAGPPAGQALGLCRSRPSGDGCPPAACLARGSRAAVRRQNCSAASTVPIATCARRRVRSNRDVDGT